MKTKRIAWLLGSALTLIYALQAEDWPQWRGPERTGVAIGQTPPEEWPNELTEIWKVKVGEGHSSPVVVSGRVYQFARVDNDEVIYCLDAKTGKEVWQVRYEAPYEVNPAAQAHGKGPKATPTVVNNRVYTQGINGTLSCVRASDGQLFWRKTFSDDFKETAPLYGVASSPLVTQGLCIVQAGGPDHGAIIAYHAGTGEEKWRRETDGPSYASSIYAEMTGERQIITQTQNWLIGLRFSSGDVLWKHPFKTDYDQNIVTPVVHEERLIYSGFNHPLSAARIDLNAQGFHFREEWTNRAHPLYMSSPVIRGNLLFGMSHRLSGHLFCVDITTGNTQWQTRGRFGENAAMVLLGDMLLIQSTEGKLTVARATGAKYEMLHEYTVSEQATWATPALDGTQIYIKDRTQLMAYRLSPK